METLLNMLVAAAFLASLIVVVTAGSAAIAIREIRRQHRVRAVYATRLAEYRRAVMLAEKSL